MSQGSAGNPPLRIRLSPEQWAEVRELCEIATVGHQVLLVPGALDRSWTQAEARAECARVIREARAQD